MTQTKLLDLVFPGMVDWGFCGLSRSSKLFFPWVVSARYFCTVTRKTTAVRTVFYHFLFCFTCQFPWICAQTIPFMQSALSSFFPGWRNFSTIPLSEQTQRDTVFHTPSICQTAQRFHWTRASPRCILDFFFFFLSLPHSKKKIMLILLLAYHMAVSTFHLCGDTHVSLSS